MENRNNKNKFMAVVVVLFVALSVWWVLINLGVLGEEGSFWYDLFSDIYGMIALIGGVYGLNISKEWGGTKSIMGRAIIAFSLGLLGQFFGQITYSFYFYVLGVVNPYPCIGDLGYFSTIPFYIYGVVMLGKASGAGINLKNYLYTLISILIPIGMLYFSYSEFLKGMEIDWSNPGVVFLSLSNTFGQAICVSLAILTYLLSAQVLGGLMRKRVFLLLAALIAQYIADFIFLYNTSRESWVPGTYSDYLYLIAYLLMTLGIIKVSDIFSQLKVSTDIK